MSAIVGNLKKLFLGEVLIVFKRSCPVKIDRYFIFKFIILGGGNGI